MGKYFNTTAEEGIGLYGRLRIERQADGFQVLKGGYVNQKGKLTQADVIAYCDTEDEAKTLVKNLIAL